MKDLIEIIHFSFWRQLIFIFNNVLNKQINTFDRTLYGFGFHKILSRHRASLLFPFDPKLL